MLDLLKALRDLEEIELQMAELYEWYGQLFRDDPDASALFSHLRMEEISHQNILKYESRIVRSNPRCFRELSLDLEMLNRTLDAVRNFRQANPRPTLEEALKMALAFECGAAELYYITIFKDTADGFAQFVTNLHAGSRNHFDKLQKFSAKKGIALPDGSVSPSEVIRAIPASVPPKTVPGRAVAAAGLKRP